MYRLLFEDETLIEVEGYQSLKIGLAQYKGTGAPKYMYLWFKSRYNDKMKFRDWESFFLTKKLKTIFTYDEEGKELKMAIQAPEPFLYLHYEEGDLIVQYGDTLYSDEAY